VSTGTVIEVSRDRTSIFRDMRQKNSSNIWPIINVVKNTNANTRNGKGKGKGNVHPITGQEGPEGE